MDSQPTRLAGENVQVLVRCRPMNDREERDGHQEVVKCADKQKQITVQLKANKSLSKTFYFDSVFGPEATQRDLFVTAIRPIVEEVLNGYNCTIFAYGTTGTGKTFTMEGPRVSMDQLNTKSVADRIKLERDAGIISRSVHQIFEELENSQSEYSVRVSHLELYNEDLRDLLNTHNSGLKLLEDPKMGVQVHNLEDIPVYNPQDIINILEKTWEERKTAETNLNTHSSRSHCIFSITIHIKESTSDGEDLIKVGKLNLVDLAGSENINRSGADRDFVRKQEAGNINKSLLTLGRVITALTEGAPHIPYRESKLTRLLRDSLGGRTKTCIIATISPNSGNLEETMSTLEYAFRAKNIKNRPEVNQKMAKREVIKEYTVEINALRSQLECMRRKSGVYLPLDTYNQIEVDVKESRDKILCLEDLIEKKLKDMEELQELFDRQSINMVRTEKMLVETESNLERTSHQLVTATSELDLTRENLDEHKILLQEHSSVEETCHREVDLILKALSTSISDIQGLSSKIDRKNLLDNENVSATSAFCQNLATVLKAAKECTIRFVSQAQNNLSGIDENALDFVSSKSEEIGMLQAKLTEVEKSVSDGCEHLKANSQAHADTILGQNAILNKINIGFNQDLQELVKKNTDESVICVEEIRELDSDHERAIKSMVAKRLQCYQNEKSDLDEFVGHQKDALGEMESEVTGFASTQGVVFAESERLLEVFWQSQKEGIDRFRSNMLMKVKDIMDDFAREQMESTRMVLDSVRDQLRKSVKNSQVLKIDMEKNIEMQKGCLGNFVKLQREGQERTSETLEQERAELQEFVDRSCSKLDGFKVGLLDSSLLIGEMIENYSGRLSKHLLRSGKEVESYVSNHARSVDHSLARVSDLKSNLSHEWVRHQLSIEELGQRCIALTKSGREVIEGFQMDFEQVSGSMRNEVDSFNLISYQSTGLTPIKRSYNYPHQLSRVRPHEIILKEIREAKVNQLVSVSQLAQEQKQNAGGLLLMELQSDLGGLDHSSIDGGGIPRSLPSPKFLSPVSNLQHRTLTKQQMLMGRQNSNKVAHLSVNAMNKKTGGLAPSKQLPRYQNTSGTVTKKPGVDFKRSTNGLQEITNFL